MFFLAEESGIRDLSFKIRSLPLETWSNVFTQGGSESSEFSTQELCGGRVTLYIQELDRYVFRC